MSSGDMRSVPYEANIQEAVALFSITWLRNEVAMDIFKVLPMTSWLVARIHREESLSVYESPRGLDEGTRTYHYP
jgi:hypothetical protein